MGGEGRSLFDLKEKAIGFVSDDGRSLVDVGNRRSGLWVVKRRSFLGGGIGDRVVDVEGAIAIVAM